MRLKVYGPDANLAACKRFFSDIEDAKIEDADNGFVITVPRVNGNGTFVKYAADRYGCSTKHIL